MAYGVVILALMVLVGRSVVGTDSKGSPVAPEAAESLSLVSDQLAAEPDADLVLVHVAGAVREPGVYELKAGSRVTDAVERAGGPRARAWLDPEGANTSFDQLAKKYRNPAAHSVVSHQDCMGCQELVTGPGGKLPRICAATT